MAMIDFLIMEFFKIKSIFYIATFVSANRNPVGYPVGHPIVHPIGHPIVHHQMIVYTIGCLQIYELLGWSNYLNRTSYPIQSSQLNIATHDYLPLKILLFKKDYKL